MLLFLDLSERVTLLLVTLILHLSLSAASYLSTSVCVLRVVLLGSLIRVVVRIVKNDVWRKAFDDPLVEKTILGSQSLQRIPLQATSDEVNE